MTTGAPSVISNGSTVAPSTTTSDVNLNEKPALTPDIPPLPSLAEKTPTQPPKSKSKWNWWKLSKEAPKSDLEKGSTPPARPTLLFAPFYSGFGAGLAICMYFFFFQNETSLTYIILV